MSAEETNRAPLTNVTSSVQDLPGEPQVEDARSLQTPAESIAGHETPKGAPQFVAPSSYLRPLSRAQAGSGSASSSRPETREGSSSGRQMTPQDREQIEGLVSRGFLLLPYK